MADDPIDDAAPETVAKPAKSKLKLIIVALVAVLALGGGGGWFFFMRGHGAEKMAEAPPAPKPPVFMDVPDVLVNLSGLPGERVQYLKMKIVLEVKDQPVVAQITPSMPRVLDIFQTYLRELRPVDLNGSAGLFRLKEELTRRVNIAVQPVQVNAVLFKEIIIQ